MPGLLIPIIVMTCITVDPQPGDIMAAADAALKRAGSFSATVERYGVGSLATRTPAVKGEVTLRRLENDPLGWRFAVQGRAQAVAETPARDFHVVYDGKVVQSLVHEDAALIESPLAGAGDLLRPSATWLAWWFMRWDFIVTTPFVTRPGEIQAWYTGQTTIDGAACDVVRVNLVDLRGLDEYEAWWYIGKDDHLPRRLDLLYYFSENIGDGMAVITMRDIRTGHDVPDSTFRISPPEGYEVKVHEPEVVIARPGRGAADARIGNIAPDWTLKDAEGKTHRLVDYRGRIVVLDFWATWCHPCVLAMPHVQKLHDAYKDKGVAVFGVNCWESGDPVKFMREKQYTYTLLLQGDPVASAYQVHGIPTFVVIGPDGRVMHYATGFDPGEFTKIEGMISRALEGEPK